MSSFSGDGLDSVCARDYFGLALLDNSVESVSSICVVEHIGLGRYGDPLDPYGSEKAIEERKRIIQSGGDLYLSLPFDDVNRIYFEAHRALKE